jgi:gluconate kinase
MIHNQLSSNNWSKLLAMAKFAYNNTMHSSTQQTVFFANHSLHPKFNIQGVHKVVHLATKDQTMWLVDVRSQFVSKFEKAQ